MLHDGSSSATTASSRGIQIGSAPTGSEACVMQTRARVSIQEIDIIIPEDLKYIYGTK